MTTARLIDLVNDLRALPEECEWAEFKVNNTNPEMIGQRISALSNGARLKDKPAGYLIYGVENGTHAVVGTTFKGAAEKHKQQPLQFWLSKALDPCPKFDFHEVAHPDGRVVLVEISPAAVSPTKFNGVAYIRIGEATPRLGDHTQLEQQLWAKLQTFAWETGVAVEYVPSERVLELLDVDAVFTMLKIVKPLSEQGVLQALAAENLIAPDVGGKWNILNLGAIVAAKDLDDFPRVARKAARLIEYVADDRVNAKKEYPFPGGYAPEFERIVDTVMELTGGEKISTLRENAERFPRLAVRELIANALIHQDMTITGAGPMIELFKNRIEITNPGVSLIDTARMIDHPPQSRNEALARLMRRMNICEERGSGIDRVVAAVEDGHLPALEIRSESA